MDMADSTLDVVVLSPIDGHVKSQFDVSLIADYRTTDGRTIEKVYRCRVGAPTWNEAYRKLQQSQGFSWWIAEHAYRGSGGIGRSSSGSTE